MGELRDLLRELVADMEGFCWEAEQLTMSCPPGARLLGQVRQRLRRVEAQIDILAPEPAPVPLWPRTPTKPVTSFVGCLCPDCGLVALDCPVHGRVGHRIRLEEH